MNTFRLAGIAGVLFALLSFSTATLAQTAIVNRETEQHQMIPGSRISMIPGSGFAPAESFTGLQNLESQSTIMVLEVNTPYAQYIEQAIPLVINNARSTMTERSRYTINGMPARLYVGTQKGDTDSLDFHRIFLVLGNEKETIALNCHYPNHPDIASDNDIMETILSVRYHPDVAVDPLQNMGFKLNTAGTSFVFTRKTGTALQYTQSQKNNWSPGAFFVDRKNLSTTVSNKSDFMLKQVAALFEVDSVLFSRELATPQALPAQEVMANLKSKQTGDIIQAYFITLFDESRAYSFIGYNINEMAMEEMRTIFRSLEIL